jgi:hypothetical protein
MLMLRDDMCGVVTVCPLPVWLVLTSVLLSPYLQCTVVFVLRTAPSHGQKTLGDSVGVLAGTAICGSAVLWCVLSGVVLVPAG